VTYPIAASPAASWRDSALSRVLGSAASWFLFTLCFTLLFLVSTVVMGLGGSCASGGPYEIAVECPDNVAAFAPLSIYGGLLAVGISLFLARGFGTPLTTWGWPVLFLGLGLAFLLANELTGYIVGGMFVIMGAVPLVLELRGSPQRVFLGQRAANGVQFYEGERARRSLLSPTAPNPENAIQATTAHWLVALAMPILFGGLGVYVARLWFTAAG
jgi:hypothetical protein